MKSTTAASPVEEAPRAVRARWSWPLTALLASHVTHDFYTALVPPMIGLLEVRCHLAPRQSAWLLGLGSLVSGLSQPAFAWLSDRFGVRGLGSGGLLLSAVALSLLGWAHDYSSLVLIYVLGMMGAGMYHPVAAASVGTISGARRSAGVSAFFVAGMLGAIAGGYFGPRIAGQPGGFEHLQWLMIPGMAMALGMQIAMPQGPEPARLRTWAGRGLERVRGRSLQIAALYLASAMRFTVNMALVYLYTRWSEEFLGGQDRVLPGDELAVQVSSLAGSLSASTFIGMGIGGLVAGACVRAGQEGRWLVWTPVAFSAAIFVFTQFQPPWTYLLAAAAGFGFASMVPVSVSLAQRLLPHHTNLASGLMLGGAWSVAIFGPPLAQWGVAHWGIPATFQATAAVLACSGILCLPLDLRSTLRD